MLFRPQLALKTHVTTPKGVVTHIRFLSMIVSTSDVRIQVYHIDVQNRIIGSVVKNIPIHEAMPILDAQTKHLDTWAAIVKKAFGHEGTVSVYTTPPNIRKLPAHIKAQTTKSEK